MDQLPLYEECFQSQVQIYSFLSCPPSLIFLSIFLILEASFSPLVLQNLSYETTIVKILH